MHTHQITLRQLAGLLLSVAGFLANANAADVDVALTAAGLQGKQAECGAIGATGANGYPVAGWHVGRYIIVGDSLVLTARSEIDNPKSPCGLGSSEGVPGLIYVGPVGLGVGSSCLSQYGGPPKMVGIGCPVEKSADWPELGSLAISGGGPHGEESIVITMGGTIATPVANKPSPPSTTPTPVPVPTYDSQMQYALTLIKRKLPAIPASVIITVNGLATGENLGLLVTDSSGKSTGFSADIIRNTPGVLTGSPSGDIQVHFDKLPNIAKIQPLGRIEVRNGWGAPVGGHFWLTRISYDYVKSVTSAPATGESTPVLVSSTH